MKSGSTKSARKKMKEKYNCSSRYAWRKMDNKVLVLDTISGDYFLLNETASFIWEGIIARQLGTREVCKKLLQEYEVSGEKVLQDVKKIIQRLKADGFLVEK